MGMMVVVLIVYCLFCMVSHTNSFARKYFVYKILFSLISIVKSYFSFPFIFPPSIYDENNPGKKEELPKSIAISAPPPLCFFMPPPPQRGHVMPPSRAAWSGTTPPSNLPRRRSGVIGGLLRQHDGGGDVVDGLTAVEVPRDAELPGVVEREPVAAGLVPPGHLAVRPPVPDAGHDVEADVLTVAVVGRHRARERTAGVVADPARPRHLRVGELEGVVTNRQRRERRPHDRPLLDRRHAAPGRLEHEAAAAAAAAGGLQRVGLVGVRRDVRAGVVGVAVRVATGIVGVDRAVVVVVGAIGARGQRVDDAGVRRVGVAALGLIVLDAGRRPGDGDHDGEQGGLQGVHGDPPESRSDVDSRPGEGHF